MAVSGVSLAANTTWLLLWLTIGLFMPLVSRAILAARVDGWRHAGRLQRRIAVFGTGPIGQRLLRKLSVLTEPDDSRIDRKGVRSGKRGSVRLGLGGRRDNK